MSIAHGCVLIAGLLPYLATGLAKTAKGFDNHAPRTWLASLTAWQARAHAAQQNSFEAFPLFAIAVVIAELTHAPEARVDTLALTFIGARIAYLVVYIADWALVRTIVWLIGIVATVMIFVAGH
jgi:uncharacterized MAPEG superfamily protein